MTPRQHLSAPKLFLGTSIFRYFPWFSKIVNYFWCSRPLAIKSRIPSERAPKTMGIHVEFVLFHGFHVEISWIKGGPWTDSGGWGPGQSGAPWWPGGECFAPFFVIFIILVQRCRCFNGSGPLPATALIPSERASKTIIISADFSSVCLDLPSWKVYLP